VRIHFLQTSTPAREEEKRAAIERIEKSLQFQNVALRISQLIGMAGYVPWWGSPRKLIWLLWM
jgi:hypothetical protein